MSEARRRCKRKQEETPAIARMASGDISGSATVGAVGIGLSFRARPACLPVDSPRHGRGYPAEALGDIVHKLVVLCDRLRAEDDVVSENRRLLLLNAIAARVDAARVASRTSGLSGNRG